MPGIPVPVEYWIYWETALDEGGRPQTDHLAHDARVFYRVPFLLWWPRHAAHRSWEERISQVGRWWHVFNAQPSISGFLAFFFCVPRSIGGVAYVTVFNSSATWAATIGCNQGERQFIQSRVKVFSQFQTVRSLSLKRFFSENEVEFIGKVNISRLEALAAGKACCARLYSYSRFIKRKPLITLGSHQGVLNFCIHSTPLREEFDKSGRK